MAGDFPRLLYSPLGEEVTVHEAHDYAMKLSAGYTDPSMPKADPVAESIPDVVVEEAPDVPQS